ncbi:MAG: GTPase domain-containing protein [Deltaproteobacteria bacterium]|nr:GTPase domain-containing protein [Deltaproteobacteria bacterium]
MALINLKSKEIYCKIVYYGPGRSGKTSNLIYIYNCLPEHLRSNMVKINTRGDRTLYFDFLPLQLGTFQGLAIKIQLYTVPGQVRYNASRKLVLQGVDGVVFVADSLKVRRGHNVESLKNLRENLWEKQIELAQIPLVMQYNKRDLEEDDVPLLPIQVMDVDLNADLKSPAFECSALNGNGVFETLRQICKMTVKDVSLKLMKKMQKTLDT